MTKATVFRASQSAVMFIAGILLGGTLIGGFPGTASTAPRIAQSESISPDRCAGGTDVSAFVCRNTWMALTKLSTR
jgi:hypothetical protein